MTKRAVLQKRTCQTHAGEDLLFNRLFPVSNPFNLDELRNSFEVSDHYRDTATCPLDSLTGQSRAI